MKEEEEEPAPVYIPSTTPCLGDFPIKATTFSTLLAKLGNCGDLDMIQKFGESVRSDYEATRIGKNGNESKCSLACLNNMHV